MRLRDSKANINLVSVPVKIIHQIPLWSITTSDCACASETDLSYLCNCAPCGAWLQIGIFMLSLNQLLLQDDGSIQFGIDFVANENVIIFVI